MEANGIDVPPVRNFVGRREIGATPRPRLLLYCGILSSLIYLLATNILGPLAWHGEYSLTAHTVSELSAVDAPSRGVMIPAMLAYGILTAAFGVGVHRAAGTDRSLRLCAALLFAFGLFGLTGPFAPMHLRGAQASLTDTLHVLGAIADVVLIVLAMAFGAAALGKRFRTYTVVSIAALLLFGALAAMDGPKIAQNLPTPWVGVTERVTLALFLVWLVVLAVALLRRREAPVLSERGRRRGRAVRRCRA